MLGIILYIYGLLAINDVLPWFTYVLFFAQPGESGILKAPSHGQTHPISDIIDILKLELSGKSSGRSPVLWSMRFSMKTIQLGYPAWRSPILETTSWEAQNATGATPPGRPSPMPPLPPWVRCCADTWNTRGTEQQMFREELYVLWISMDLNGFIDIYRNLNGFIWNLNGFIWNLNGFRWIYTDHYRSIWIWLDWSYMDVTPWYLRLEASPTFIIEFYTSSGWWLGHPSEKYDFVSWDD